LAFLIAIAMYRAELFAGKLFADPCEIFTEPLSQASTSYRGGFVAMSNMGKRYFSFSSS
jgi:hypothetical protein